MPRRPWLAALVLVGALLTACTADDGPEAGAPTTPTGLPGVLDAVAEEVPLDQDGPDGHVQDMVLDATGQPALLFVPPEEGPLLLAHRLPDGWEAYNLTDQNTLGYSSSVAAADDGSLLVAGYADRRYSLTRIAPDDSVTTVPVADDLAPDATGLLSPALSPDGGTLYLAVVDRRTESRLLAVDPRTGAVRTTYRFPATAAGIAAPTAVRVAGDRVLVTLDRGIAADDAPSGEAVSPWLARFDLDLQPLGEVQLTEPGGGSGFGAVAVDESGDAYAAVVVGEYASSDVETRVLRVARDAGTATTVATFPGDDLVDGLAVDPAGEWAYVAGLDDGEEQYTITVTAIDLSGERDPVTTSYCEGTEVDDLAVTPDGGALLVAATCADRDVHPTLFTLR